MDEFTFHLQLNYIEVPFAGTEKGNRDVIRLVWERQDRGQQPYSLEDRAEEKERVESNDVEMVEVEIWLGPKLSVGMRQGNVAVLTECVFVLFSKG